MALQSRCLMRFLHRRRLYILLPLFILSNIIAEVSSWQTTGKRSTASRFTRLISLKMSAAASPSEQEEIIMLSGYPFYMNGPDPKAIEDVAKEAKKVLEQACGDQLVSVSRMGSSAIDGIAGTPVCDLLAQLSPWPMTEDAKAKMEKSGYEFKGNAPHFSKDEWFFGGDGEPGHLGRVVLHTVPQGCDFARAMKAFVEYVNSHPDAFQRYNGVKVEGAMLMSKSEEEEGRLIGYKMKKSDICKEIMKEATEWWTRTNVN